MISPAYRELRKRHKNSKTLKTLHPLKIIHFIHFVQGGKLTRHFDGSGQNRTMTIISLYSPDLWGRDLRPHGPGAGKNAAQALGYGEGKSLANAVANHADEKDKGVTEWMTPSGTAAPARHLPTMWMMRTRGH